MSAENTSLVECVPNFSEGKDEKKIASIAQAITQEPGVRLLNVDCGLSANRTVITFVGDPQTALEAAYQAISKAAELIDMRFHKGIHPRVGATDVFPFVPLVNTTMEDCVHLSNQLAKRVGQNLSIPIYLYANSARHKMRRQLSYIRHGQYESLSSRMLDSDFVPDYGPSDFNARSGITAIGARPILVAYNINLATTSQMIARDIAKTIRVKRDLKGDSANSRLPACTALGWYVEEMGCAQISLNILDFKKTPLYEIYQIVCQLAKMQEVEVTGSEIVGLVPLLALLEAGRSAYLKEGITAPEAEEHLIAKAQLVLGLGDKKEFLPGKKILEYCLANAGYSVNMIDGP